MKAITIIPPLVQLNAPYPSGAYLTSFFKSEGLDASWTDLSIELFYAIFCRAGLEKLFELSEVGALEKADKAEKAGDENTAFNLRRYISTKASWIEWIDFITAVLSGGGAREKEHQFLYSPFAPRGQRMENFLAGLVESGREPSVDDVRFLCSYALADLADYITAAFDPNFSLIRYAEHLTVDERSFSELEKELDSPVLEHFYKPVLEKLFEKDPRVKPEDDTRGEPEDDTKDPVIVGLDPTISLICISIPFAGTFIPALYTARWLKQKYGDKVFICIGGGFVNTELRDAREPALGKYIDAISYDRGYGSYHELFKSAALRQAQGPHILPVTSEQEPVVPEQQPVVPEALEGPLYKMRLFLHQNAQIKILDPIWENEELEKFEASVTPKIIPDYSDIDFTRYLRVCDDANSMHRLWTDGAWIKAYLAHGCYWHRCAFCDTNLDYVCGYKPVNTDALYEGLLKTAREKNIWGIHFVDEAMPPAALKKFALQNARSGNPLYFWGNIRFEKAFTKDFAAFLSYCGLGGVSAGIEVATGAGLKYINKGTDISSIINACAAFKEAGILIHAYMIYGFWYDTPQTIIDSMETLRQFFAAGLLDSSFWHKFVLTRNSTVYTEWKEGRQPDLQPVEAKDGAQKEKLFANNNLHFKGEGSYDKFGAPLEAALDAWMHGLGLEKKVQKWFDFALPAPTIPRDFVDRQIQKYEKQNSERAQSLTPEKVSGLYWLGGTPVRAGKEYRWIYLMEEQTASATTFKQIEPGLLQGLAPEATDATRAATLKKLEQDAGLVLALKNFFGRGLVLLDF